MKNRILMLFVMCFALITTAQGALIITEIGDTSDTDTNQAGFIYWNPINTTVTGNAIIVSINVQNPAGNGRIALYNNSAGAPNTLLNETSSQALTLGWNNFSLIYNITAGNEYWIATQMSNAANVNYRSASGTLRFAAQAYGAFPATAPALTSGARALNQRLHVQTVDNPLPIYVSSTNKYSNNTLNTTSSTAYVKLSEITLTENYTGSFNTSWFSSTNNISYTKIYKNGVALGTEKITTSATTGTIGEDFYFSAMASGDNIQIYGKAGNPVDVTFINTFGINFNYDYANYTPTLVYPTDTSTISFSFPPLTTNINFSWSSITGSGYEIMVAEDAAFNIITADTTSTTNYKSITLQNKTYYWKVRTYNDAGATLGNWSSTYSFTLAATTTSISGTALNGVVYELIDGSPVPVEGASVYLSNATRTYQFLTGSNGYYLFTGLVNTTTYSIYAIKQGYDNSQTFSVVPTYNSTTTLNIPVRIYISPYIPNFVFEKIVVRTLYDEPYPGITVNVYKGTSLAVSFTGTTDYNGVVVFQLIKDQSYRMTLSGGSLSSTLTFHFYAKEETQRITATTGFPTGGNKYADINATLSVSSFNTTYSNLSLFYDDVSLTTSVINFYTKNLTTGVYTCANQSTTTYPITLNCTVAMNGSYQFGYNATSSRYGFIQQDKIVNFNASNTSVPQGELGGKVSASMLNWISIIGLIFIAGLFSIRSVKYGVVVVPLMAVILYWFGVLSVSGTIVHMALVFGVIAYIRMSEYKVVS